MDDHAGGFVDDGDVFVLVENIERDGFGFDAGRQLLGDLDGHDFVRLDAMRGLARDSVNLHAAFVHERLNARAAQRRELRDEEEVESLAGVFGSDDEFHVCRGYYDYERPAAARAVVAGGIGAAAPWPRSQRKAPVTISAALTTCISDRRS